MTVIGWQLNKPSTFYGVAHSFQERRKIHIYKHAITLKIRVKNGVCVQTCLYIKTEKEKEDEQEVLATATSKGQVGDKGTFCLLL